MNTQYAILTLILCLFGFTGLDELPAVQNVVAVNYKECLNMETATGSTVTQAIAICRQSI